MALSFMELWAGAEPAVLSRAPRQGHARPSACRAAAAGPPGLSQEPRGAERTAAAGREQRRRAAADPVLWPCPATRSTAWRS